MADRQEICTWIRELIEEGGVDDSYAEKVLEAADLLERDGAVLEALDAIDWPTVPASIAGTDQAKPWIEGRDAAARAFYAALQQADSGEGE